MNVLLLQGDILFERAVAVPDVGRVSREVTSFQRGLSCAGRLCRLGRSLPVGNAVGLGN